MKVSDFAIKSIIDVLTRDTRLMVGGDVTRAEGLSATRERSGSGAVPVPPPRKGHRPGGAGWRVQRRSPRVRPDPRGTRRCDLQGVPVSVMKKVFSKKVRDQAALICAIAASGGVWVQWASGGGWQSTGYLRIRDATETSPAALHLAILAWAKAGARHGTWTREVDAEAEALLRTGWTPS